MWKGFYKESKVFMNVHNINSWIKFILGYPRAYFRLKKLDSK